MIKNINKQSLDELRSFTKPPALVIEILSVTMILVYGAETFAKEKLDTWAGIKKALSDSNKFLSLLISVDLQKLKAEDITKFDSAWQKHYTVD